MSEFSIKGSENIEKWLDKEWLVANGLGGYSSNSISCVPTRKYHGFLVASLPQLGRTVMLNHLLEIVILPNGEEIVLNNVARPNGMFNKEGLKYLEEFYLENGLPVWIYNCKGYVIEKKIVMTYMQNTTHVIFKLLKGDQIQLKLCPYFHFLQTYASLHEPMAKEYKTSIFNKKYEIALAGFPKLKMHLEGENVNFALHEQMVHDVFFEVDARRGYEALTKFWSPGFLTVSLSKNLEAAFTASTENWEEILALTAWEAKKAENMRRELLYKKAPKSLQNSFGKTLILGADQFIITPASRIQDKVRANAAGNEVRTVIAGYHWFTDWGRDTMISLEGLTLCTGRIEEARWILRTFAHYVKEGLIPNMFPEGEKEGVYYTADASLWYFHALNRYLLSSNDVETLFVILPKLKEIYEFHMKGTLFGIRVDPVDNLLIQGSSQYPLTWMDAKVEDWIVTPRRGKAVEINALWYNALRLLAMWTKESDPSFSEKLSSQADKVYLSFNQKFWNENKKCLFDVIEGEKGNDDAVRPNQLFAISLDHPVLDEKYWTAILDKTTIALFTPIGLRSLSPEHPDFKIRYDGDLRARDSAYHQGTIWSWLIGPYIDVWLKVYPNDKSLAEGFLNGFQTHFYDAGIGYISEIFDATAPFAARGCIAQAWSIAELLRSLNKVKS